MSTASAAAKDLESGVVLRKLSLSLATLNWPLRKISVSQHGEILRTLQARDSARAKEQMRSHWLCSMENSLRDVAGLMQGGEGAVQDVLTK